MRLLERLDFRDFKISVKSSHVPTMIRAYRMLSEKVRGRMVSRAVFERISAVGIALMLAVFVIGLQNDLGQLISPGPR